MPITRLVFAFDELIPSHFGLRNSFLNSCFLDVCSALQGALSSRIGDAKRRFDGNRIPHYEKLIQMVKF